MGRKHDAFEFVAGQPLVEGKRPNYEPILRCGDCLRQLSKDGECRGCKGSTTLAPVEDEHGYEGTEQSD